MHPPLVMGALLAGCVSPAGEGSDPGSAADPPTVVGPSTFAVPTGPPPATGGARLELGDAVACVDPGARVARRFDVEELDVVRAGALAIEGGGMVVADLDGDGLVDLLAAGAPPKLFRGADGGRAFVEDAGALAGLPVDGMVGGSAADYDGDGDLDVFLARWGRGDVLLRNDGGALVDATAEAGVAGPGLASVSSAWDDFDGDGDLDLVVGRYGLDPDPSAEEMAPGHPSSLWRSRGDGTFEDASAALPPEVQDAWKFMTAWYDLDDDGDRELFSVHDFGWDRPSRMLRNDGGALVLDGSAGFHPDYEGMGLGVGDVNRDGLPDLLQTSSRRISLLTSHASASSATGVIYVESAAALGLAVEPGTGTFKGQDWGWGAAIGDLDDDGDLDAMAAYGDWEPWLGNPEERDALWLFEGGGFAEVAGAPEWGLDWTASTRGLLLVDLDGDGFLDVLRNALDAPFRVDRSRCGREAWLSVSLDDGLVPANRWGVGARVDALAGGVRRTAWIVAGGTSLFSGGPPVAHLGLGDATVVDSLCVTWPDGGLDCFDDLAPRRPVVVRRG